MVRSSGIRVRFGLAAVLLWVGPTHAQPLKIANADWWPVACSMDTACTFPNVTGSSVNIPLPGVSGQAWLEARAFQGSRLWPSMMGYTYGVDLTQAVGTSCVSILLLNFGPVVKKFDFDLDRLIDQVFVLTSGGWNQGTIGLKSAVKIGNYISFHFASPICAGSSPGNGTASLLFGLVAPKASYKRSYAQVSAGNHRPLVPVPQTLVPSY
jgi:hypothetical protein